MEGYILQDVNLIVIGKAYVLENDIPFHGRHDRIVFIRNFRFGIEYLKDTFSSCKIGDDLVIKITQVHDRTPEHTDISAKGDKGTKGYLICTKNADADKVHGSNTKTPGKINNGAKTVIHAAGSYERMSVFFYQHTKGFCSFLLSRKALDDPDAGNIFVDKGIQIGSFFTEDLPALVGDRLDQPHTKSH